MVVLNRDIHVPLLHRFQILFQRMSNLAHTMVGSAVAWVASAARRKLLADAVDEMHVPATR